MYLIIDRCSAEKIKLATTLASGRNIASLSKEKMHDIRQAAKVILSAPDPAKYTLPEVAQVSLAGVTALRNWVSRDIIKPAAQEQDRTYRFSARQAVYLRVIAGLSPMDPRYSVPIAKHVSSNISGETCGRYVIVRKAGVAGSVMRLDEAEDPNFRGTWLESWPYIIVPQIDIIVDVALALAVYGK
jgi:hypothetical protein